MSAERTMTAVTQPGESLKADRDMISNLHESLLTNILSRLSTEDAVRTSILSQDWRYKWTFINKVRINDMQPVMVGQRRKDEYVNYVNRVLRLPKNASSFDIKLQHIPYGSDCIRSWLSYMLDDRPNLESLIFRYRQDTHLRFVFPSILNCTKLREFVLEWRWALNFPATSFLPNLSHLFLNGVTIVNENPETDGMILKFPVLETLTMKVCSWQKVKTVEINAPSLTSFHYATGDYFSKADKLLIRIIGARLTKFESSSGMLEDIDFTNGVATVVSAGFMNMYNLVHNERSSSESTSRARKLMEEMLHVEHLKMTSFMLENILQSGRLCQYNRLRRLILCQTFGQFQWSIAAVWEILSVAPYLKFFTIEGIIWDYYHGDDTIIPPCPSCIMHHLEEVKFIYSVYNITNPLHIEKFLLKNATQLRKCYIGANYDNIPKRDIVKRLSSIIPESSTCQILVASARK